MALINCPECNKEISDKAGNCPHCGCPIEKRLEIKEKKNKKVPKVLTLIPFLAVIGVAIFIIYTISGSPNTIKINNFKIISYNDNQQKVEKLLGNGIDTPVSLLNGYDYDGKLKLVYDNQSRIRYIEVEDRSITTYKNIKIGDDASKIENKFKYEIKTSQGYSVLFDNKKELDSNAENQKDSLIWINYLLDNSNKIKKIIIYDYKFGKTMS